MVLCPDCSVTIEVNSTTKMRDMAEHFNIEVKTTAAYSPWSNGLLE